MTDSKAKGQRDPKSEGQTDTGSPVKPASPQDEQAASNSAGSARSDEQAAKRQDNLTSTPADDEDKYAESDKRYEPRRKTHRKPLKGSQMDETGEGSPVLKTGQFGRLVDPEGRELSVLERLVMLEGDSPVYGSHV